MGVYRYPDEVHKFVKEWSCKLPDKELAKACNEKLGTSFTARSMLSFRKNHGYIHNGPKQYCEEYWKYQDKYPQGMYEFIRDNSLGISSEDMARMVNEKYGTNWTRGGMKQFRRRYGIRSGLTGHYHKGHVPGNKGKKLEEIISDPERLERVRARIAETQFLTGHESYNTMPVGTITKTSDGYLIRKRQMEGSQWERWEFLHKTVWEENNGPIPEGMVVSFKDGNITNLDINNLMLISKSENMALNKRGYRFKDPELTETGLNLIKLESAVKEKRRMKEK